MLRNANYSQRGGRDSTMRGIIVGRHGLGEGSVRVSLYTDLRGLITAFAKSAREERSKLRPHLMVGTIGMFTLVEGHRFRVTGVAGAHNIYFSLSGIPEAQKSAARVLGAVRQFVRGEGSDPYLFQTLWDFLHTLGTVPADTITASESVAVLRMLAALGYVSEKHLSVFFGNGYGEDILNHAKEANGELVRVINESMAISGLSETRG